MAAERVELRQLIPSHLAVALDGIAMADGMERCRYIEAVLEAEVRKRAHVASVITRVLRGNPMLPDTDGSAAQ